MIKNGRIKQSLAYWCLNATDWKWDIDRVCEAAGRLGCRSVELAPPEQWGTIRKYGLENALAHNGMADPVFAKGLNNPLYQKEVIARTKESIDQCADAGVPNVIAFTGYKWKDADDPTSGEIPPAEGAANTVKGAGHGLNVLLTRVGLFGTAQRRMQMIRRLHRK